MSCRPGQSWFSIASAPSGALPNSIFGLKDRLKPVGLLLHVEACETPCSLAGRSCTLSKSNGIPEEILKDTVAD